jgi:hypothetical protein
MRDMHLAEAVVVEAEVDCVIKVGQGGEERFKVLRLVSVSASLEQFMEHAGSAKPSAPLGTAKCN